MSKKDYIIRFHLTAHEDYKVEADSPEDAYKMYESGEYANYHEDIGVLYGSKNKFHGIWEIGEDGKWIGKGDDPLIRCKDYVHPFDHNYEKPKKDSFFVRLDSFFVRLFKFLFKKRGG